MTPRPFSEGRGALTLICIFILADSPVRPESDLVRTSRSEYESSLSAIRPCECFFFSTGGRSARRWRHGATRRSAAWWRRSRGLRTKQGEPLGRAGRIDLLSLTVHEHRAVEQVGRGGLEAVEGCEMLQLWAGISTGRE